MERFSGSWARGKMGVLGRSRGGSRNGFLTNKANLESGKSAASGAAGATCCPTGTRRLPKTNPFGEAWRTGEMSNCRFPLSNWARFARGPLPPKHLRISGRLRNFPFRSGTFRNFPFLSVLFRLVPTGSSVARRRLSATAAPRPRRACRGAYLATDGTGAARPCGRLPGSFRVRPSPWRRRQG